MKNILKYRKYWGYILLGIIILFVILGNLLGSNSLISHDNYSTELNPLLSIKRYLFSPALRDYRGLTIASDGEAADIVTAFLAFVIKGIGLNFRVIYYFIALFVGSFSIGLLSKRIYEILFSKKDRSQLIFFIAGLIYITTLWTVWIYYQNIFPYIVNFGFLPLFLLISTNYVIKGGKYKVLAIFIASLLLTPAFTIPTLFIVDILFILIFLLTIAWILKGKGNNGLGYLKRIVITTSLFIITQLFWLLPAIFYFISTADSVTSSYINQTITSSVIDLERGMQTFPNTLRFYTRVLTDSTNSGALFKLSNIYLENDFFKAFSIYPTILAFLGATYLLFKKKFKLLPIVLISFLVISIINIDNAPFAGIYLWLSENVSYFKQIFRWPSSKLFNILLINIAIFAPFGILLMIEIFESIFRSKYIQKFLYICAVLFVIVTQLSYSKFLFNDNLFSEVSKVSVPQEYYDLGKYLEQTDPIGRIYYAPPSNNNYFREYEWGFYGSQFISYILPNPVLDISHTVGSSVGENALLDLSNAFRSNDLRYFDSLLAQYDVGYMLVDRSTVKKGFSFEVDLDNHTMLWEGKELVWSSDNLELYRVETPIAKYADLGSLNILDIQLTSLENIDGVIIGEFTQTSEDMQYEMRIASEQLSKYPISLKVEDNYIYVRPIYPSITSSESTSSPYMRARVDPNTDRIETQGVRYDIEDLAKGINLDIPYSKNIKIYETVNSVRRNLDLSINNSDVNESIYLEKGEQYQVEIPILNSSQLFTFSSNDIDSDIWDEKVEETKSHEISYTSDIGVRQSVVQGYIESNTELFPTSPNSTYIIHFEGENISNIPANICIYYDIDQCWHREILKEEVESNGLSRFVSSEKAGKKLHASFNTRSYTSESINTLSSLTIFKTPQVWNEVKYISDELSSYDVKEIPSISKSLPLNIYKLKESTANTIFTLPHSSSTGWILLTKDDGVYAISEGAMTVDGWKQGWKLENGYESITAIFWPNILGYIGYTMLISTAVIIVLKLKKDGKK